MQNNKGVDVDALARIRDYEERITDALLEDVDWVDEAHHVLTEEEAKDYEALRDKYL